MPDFDLVVIGSGPAGYSAALRAAELGAGVAVVEHQSAGGNCVRFNCVPSNILLDTVRAALESQALGLQGVLPSTGEPSFSRALARQAHLVAGVEAGIRNLLASRRVRYVAGRAKLVAETDGSGLRVVVQLGEGGTEEISAGAVIVATGARGVPPALPGLPPDGVLTSDQLLALAEPPPSLLVLGGGPAGLVFALEYAFLFTAFGSRVTLAESGPHVLPGEDAELAGYLAQALETAGLRVLTGAQVKGFDEEGGEQRAVLSTPAGDTTVPAAAVVAPDCRVPYLEGLGLDALGVRLGEDGALAVDASGTTTSVSGLYGAGDAIGGIMLSHAAIHEGRVAAENALGQKSRLDLRAVPRCIHTHPEYAAVGLSDEQARAAGREVRVGLADLSANARAAALGQQEGAVKLVGDARTGEILGVHILGPQASELIGQAVLAMRLEATVYDLAATVHWHPSLSEALTEAARRALPP
jgi:dihydrolipoamide dehydrogenase